MIRKTAAIALAAALLAACAAPQPAPQAQGKTIVVTYSILGSVVRELVGDQAQVIVPMPDGQDPHEWEPSARDIEAIMHADLIVQNGLGLEGGMEKTLEQARAAGVKVFTASDHITVRRVQAGEGIPTGDPDQAAGAEDPHLWMDPVSMGMVVEALAPQIKTDLGTDVSGRAADLKGRLDSLSQEIDDSLSDIPEEDRKLVTGHESMGYFAARYHLQLIGAVIPGVTSQAEVSASDLAALKQAIEANRVPTVFTEVGTPQSVVEAIGQDTGVRVVQITTHRLPEDGSYFTYMRNLAKTIGDGLRQDQLARQPDRQAVAGPEALGLDIFILPFTENDFMQRALMAGVLVSLACAVVGTFVVLRGLAFIGDALAHGVLPGIAVSILLGVPGIIGAAVGALVMIGGISLITQKSRLSSDTAIGLLFVGMLALGVVIVSRSDSFSGDLVRVLFGEILGTSIQGILIQLAATVIVGVTALVCARPFLLLCFNPEQAQVAGFPARLYHAIMLGMVALTVIVSFQTVGTLLVFGMLLAPAGAGALVARRIGSMMGWAALFGAVSVYIGLLVSYHFRLAAGSSIVLAAVILFFIVFFIQNRRGQAARSAETPA